MGGLLVPQNVSHSIVLTENLQRNLGRRVGFWTTRDDESICYPCFVLRDKYRLFSLPVADGITIGTVVRFYSRLDRCYYDGRVLYLNQEIGLGVFRLLYSECGQEFFEPSTLLDFSKNFFRLDLWNVSLSHERLPHFVAVPHGACGRFDQKYTRMFPDSIGAWANGSVFFLPLSSLADSYTIIGMMTTVRIHDHCWLRCIIGATHMLAAVRAAADAYIPPCDQGGGGGHSLVHGETF